MIFSRYGIELERMARHHLEMVRQWRNSEWVNSRMHIRDKISAEAQETWFARLHPRRDWYFVALMDKNPIGLFHVKNIGWAEKKGEAGAFVGDPGHIGGPHAAVAVLALMDFGFFVLGLRKLEAKYNAEFTAINVFNSQLGYRVFAEETDGFIRAEVTAERYLEMAARWRDAGEKWGDGRSSLTGTDGWIDRKVEKMRKGGRLMLF
jgi:RimJ/RimL family protein N-acetyltransferase